MRTRPEVVNFITMPCDGMNKIHYMPYSVDDRDFEATCHAYDRPGQSVLDVDIAHQSRPGKRHRARQVWFDRPGKSHSLKDVRDGHIYVRGQGNAGMDSIAGGPGGSRVDHGTIVSRMIENGLSKKFSGTIKCFNCHSASPGTTFVQEEGKIRSIESEAFAQVMERQLRNKGYKKCAVQGYFGQIDRHVKHEQERGTHHYSRRLLENPRTSVSAQVIVGRAKDNRREWPARGGLSAVVRWLNCPIGWPLFQRLAAKDRRTIRLTESKARSRDAVASR